MRMARAAARASQLPRRHPVAPLALGLVQAPVGRLDQLCARLLALGHGRGQAHTDRQPGAGTRFPLPDLSAHYRHVGDWVFRSRVSELPQELFEVPTLWVHGHIHQNFDYHVGPCRVVTNPRGYVRWDGAMVNTAFDPGLVVDLATTDS